MKKRAYLEWLIRQHSALKEQVDSLRGRRDAEEALVHLKREKLHIKDRINTLLDEISRDGSASAS